MLRRLRTLPPPGGDRASTLPRPLRPSARLRRCALAATLAVALAVALTVALTVAGAIVPVGGPSTARANPSCPQGAVFNVVAHQDDDLLFLSPDLLHDVQANRCVRTVFVTAGDAGRDATYWGGREEAPGPTTTAPAPACRAAPAPTTRTSWSGSTRSPART